MRFNCYTNYEYEYVTKKGVSYGEKQSQLKNMR